MNSRRRNTFRIDYDKLAEAIVKSQNTVTKDEIKNAIVDANKEIENKSKKHTYSGEVLSFLVTPILSIFSVISLALVGLTIHIVITKWNIFVKDFISGVFVIFVALLLVVVGVVFAYLCWQACRELRKTDDYHLTSTMLTTVSSFVAMIIAIIALMFSVKG